MPILFLLFYGLRNWLPAESAIAAGHYSFFWIQDLSITVKNTPYPWFLPIGCALVTMVQQYMSTTNRQDMTQKMMLILMPAMFLFMTQQFPSALAIYWLFYGFFTMLQTSYLNYRYKAGIFAPKEEKTKSKITMAAEMYDKEQEKKEKVQQKHDDKQSQVKHGATHNMSQKNTEVMAENEGQREYNQKDKPWQ
jgi:YidC/Oxa1 family membrane protein insertase